MEPDRQGGRVLVVSASVGAGHNQAARAVVERLREYAPHLEVEHVDALNFAGRCFRAWYAGGYALMVSRLPWLYGLGFRMTDHPDGPRRSLAERRRLWTERLAMRRMSEHILAGRYDLILHTHFLVAPMVARMKDLGLLDCPQAVVVTDNVIHRYWHSRNVERWFLSADLDVDRVARWGVERERIVVSGMPVQAKWRAELDRSRVLAEWDLPADRPIVLLSGGTDFVCGPVVRIADQLARAREDLCVVVLGGRNKKLLGQLAGLRLPGDRLRPVAFTDRLHELVEASSLMITKAGGSTIAECAARGKPMVFLKPVPGQEKGNAQYFAAAGAGVVAPSVQETIQQTLELVGDPQRLAAMSQAAAALYRPASETIADWVIQRLGDRD
ncbi:MAG TPA: glycosyltransferase [Phycisphaerae bacterium]|nr:glycosyltransferase [Phycisphaerae bacterium]HQL73528.1 glycosyltransferase [Phycisphaerae bacterium]